MPWILSLNRGNILFGCFIAICLISGCRSNTEKLPSTEPPILESIFVVTPSERRIVAQNTGGDYNVLPCDSFELRVRSPLLSDFRIFMNNQTLAFVSGRARHPELDASGYFSFTEEVLPGAGYGFYRIWVVPPLAIRNGAGSQIGIQIRKISLDSTLPSNQRETNIYARFAAVGPTGDPIVAKVEPSTVFDDGWNSKNSRDPGLWQAHAKQSIVARKVTLAGWLAKDFPHRNNGGIFVERSDQSEDWQYTIWLDPDFIERTYGGQQSAQPLAGTILPGNPTSCIIAMLNDCYPGGLLDTRYPIEANDIPLLSQAVVPDVGTFLLTNHHDFTVELNAWHRSRRGAPPAGWVGDPDPAYADNAWPFPPKLPFDDGSGRQLNEGDYVIVSGTLWQDSGHRPSSGEPDFDQRDCWFRSFPGQDGWLEIHPADMVRRVAAPKVRKHTQVVALCAPPNQTKSVTMDLVPFEPYDPSKPQLKWREYVDPRFSKGGRTILANTVTDSNGGNRV